MVTREEVEKEPNKLSKPMKITVLMNGPYIVTGRVPLLNMEISKNENTDRLIWREVVKYPVKEKYSLCRCGSSGNKPFCDGTHAKIHFDGTEAGDFEPHRAGANIIRGSLLTLIDNKHLCVHAEFCTRAGESGSLSSNPKIWKPATLLSRSMQLPFRQAGYP